MTQHWVLTYKGSQVATFSENYDRSIAHGKRRLVSKPVDGWTGGGYALSLEDKPEPPAPEPIDPLKVKLKSNQFFTALLSLQITESDVVEAIKSLEGYTELEKEKMLIDFRHPDGDGDFSFYHPLIDLLRIKKGISEEQAKAAWIKQVNS